MAGRDPAIQAADCAGPWGLDCRVKPGNATVGSTISTLLRAKSLDRRAGENPLRPLFSRDVLLDAIRKAQVDPIVTAGENEALSICYRYALAARDGAAKRNLKLLAQTIVALAERDRLFSDEFNKYADLLARMTRDQILVVGRFLAHFHEERRTRQDTEHARSDAWKRMVAELVPNAFPNEEYLKSIASQATGLGLLLALSAFGSLVYAPSPLLEEIAELADFDVAARE